MESFWLVGVGGLLARFAPASFWLWLSQPSAKQIDFQLRLTQSAGNLRGP
jgi:hypothetical protein